MGAAELTSRQPRGFLADVGADARARTATHVVRIAVCYGALWTLTCVGALIGTAAPALAPDGQPHPTLHGTLGEFASIAITNARVLSAPFLLTMFHFLSGRRSRQLGDLVVAGLLGSNALRVGLALGRWHAELLPYLPQLPLEWLAAALAAAAWLTVRTGAPKHTAPAYVAAVLVLVAAAAAIETTCTPHAATREPRPAAALPTGSLRPSGPISLRKAWGGLPAPDRAPVPALASRSLRSLPLAVARFRSAVWSALPDYVNHPRIPQRRDQE
jgi:hypothetical protein